MIPWTLYKRVLVKVKLSSDEIAKLLSDEIAVPTKSLFGQTPIIGNKFYMGEVSNKGFEIRRIIYTRNSFMPIIYGKLIPESPETQVNILITLHPIIIAFSILLCTPLILGFMVLFFGSLINFPDNLGMIPLAVIPFSMLVLYYFFVLLGFGAEANTAEKYIMSFFDRVGISK